MIAAQLRRGEKWWSKDVRILVVGHTWLRCALRSGYKMHDYVVHASRALRDRYLQKLS